MRIGVVGLGRMGGNMARRLMKGGHEVVAYATDPASVKQLAGEGATGTTTLDDFVARLRAPRTAWVMVPAGAATEQVVMDLAERMEPGDTIIDGGNSFYKDDGRRMKMLKDQKLHYVDVGTSGGVWGLERGYCLMIGGEKAVVERLDQIFRTLGPGMGEIPRTPGRAKIPGTAEHDMVEASWKLATPLLDVWQTLPPRDFPNYPAGSHGPASADELIHRDGRKWRNPE